MEGERVQNLSVEPDGQIQDFGGQQDQCGDGREESGEDDRWRDSSATGVRHEARSFDRDWSGH